MYIFYFIFLAVTSRAAVYNCVIGCLDTFSKLFQSARRVMFRSQVSLV